MGVLARRSDSGAGALAGTRNTGQSQCVHMGGKYHAPTMPSASKNILLVPEIAADLNVCEETVRRLTKRGLLTRVIGVRHIKVTREAYEDFLRNRFVTPRNN